MASECRIIERLQQLLLLLVAIALLFITWVATFGKLLQPLMNPGWCANVDGGWRTSTFESPPGPVDPWLQEWGLPLIAISFVVTLVTSLVVLRRRS